MGRLAPALGDEDEEDEGDEEDDEDEDDEDRGKAPPALGDDDEEDEGDDEDEEDEDEDDEEDEGDEEDDEDEDDEDERGKAGTSVGWWEWSHDSSPLSLFNRLSFNQPKMTFDHKSADASQLMLVYAGAAFPQSALNSTASAKLQQAGACLLILPLNWVVHGVTQINP